MRGGKKDTSFFSSVKFVKKCKKMSPWILVRG